MTPVKQGSKVIGALLRPVSPSARTQRTGLKTSSVLGTVALLSDFFMICLFGYLSALCGCNSPTPSHVGLSVFVTGRNWPLRVLVRHLYKMPGTGAAIVLWSCHLRCQSQCSAPTAVMSYTAACLKRAQTILSKC